MAAIGTSSAARKPTRAERVAISELTTQPARCIDITVSTVDPSWAIFYSRGLRSCPGADGYVVVHKTDGLWEYVTSNGGTDQSPCSAVRPVPPAVGGDLKICMLPRDCGTLRIEGYNLPIRITQGRMRCTTARKVVRTFFPRHGRGQQTFRVGDRRWFCANSHGSELERGGVAHCLSDWYRIMVYEPGS
jgi:hypothetical protein